MNLKNKSRLLIDLYISIAMCMRFAYKPLKFHPIQQGGVIASSQFFKMFLIQSQFCSSCGFSDGTRLRRSKSIYQIL